MVSFPSSDRVFRGQPIWAPKVAPLSSRFSPPSNLPSNPTIMPAERAGVSDVPLSIPLTVPNAVLKSVCHRALGLAVVVHSDDVSQMTVKD